MFITIEGPDGAGKSTQIKLLHEYLTAQNMDVVLTREAGGTPLAEKIRSMLFTRDAGDWEYFSEVLLLYAGRLEHVEKKIKPALNNGSFVVCDRFADSTLVYQGYGRGIEREKILNVEALTLGDFKPDLTLVLDIDVKKGLERTGVRFGENNDGSNTEDKFERLGLGFHEKIRAGFLDIASKNPDRCVVINADQPIESIFSDIKTVIDARIKAGGSHVAAG